MALELLRVLHEELDVLEQQIAHVLERKPKALKAALRAELRVAAYMYRSQDVARRLQHLHEDADKSKQREVAALSMRDASDSEHAGNIEAFFERLKAVEAEAAGTLRADTSEFGVLSGANLRPAAATPLLATELVASITAGPNEIANAALASWTPEELYGRYIDLRQAHEAFINLPFIRDHRSGLIGGTGAASQAHDDASAGGGREATAAAASDAARDYSSYLKRFTDIHSSLLPSSVRLSRPYRRYICAVAAYWTAWWGGSHPLAAVTEVLDAVWAKVFWPRWCSGKLTGWTKVTSAEGGQARTTGSAAPSPDALLDLPSFATLADLTTRASAEAITEDLKRRGLKAGGTPVQRAERLWSVRGLQPAQYPSKLKAPAATAAAAPTSAAPAADEAPSEASGAAEDAVGAAEGSAGRGGEGEWFKVDGLRALLTCDPVAYARGHATTEAAAHPETAAAASHPHLITAWCETLGLTWANLCEETLIASRKRVDKRSTRTVEELEAERAAEEEEAEGPPEPDTTAAPDGSAGDVVMGDSYDYSDGSGAPATGIGAYAGDDDEDDLARRYGSGGQHLDKDGRPIPLWLYKLQGLNIEFRCEICGDVSYWGRRAFDRHFAEWRHAASMRRLGIPNTRHFHDVTRIEDAQRLYAQLLQQAAAAAADGAAAADVEELEDSLGNLMSRKTYEDLARQGLL